jgi:hypothetical protein
MMELALSGGTKKEEPITQPLITAPAEIDPRASGSASASSSPIFSPEAGCAIRVSKISPTKSTFPEFFATPGKISRRTQ